MPYEDARDKSPEGPPSLKDMTSAAIKILKKNKNGFVLAVRIYTRVAHAHKSWFNNNINKLFFGANKVEGGLIDYAHHRGFARRALGETVMFNDAIAEAVKLTGNDDDTLIIVTSDHSHNLNINGYSYKKNDILGK